jgi:hypothetical protein
LSMPRSYNRQISSVMRELWDSHQLVGTWAC